MAKYNIKTIPYEMEIEAEDAECALNGFAIMMDSDMHNYFEAVPQEKDPVMSTYVKTYIKELAYELYKLDWMRRISVDRQMDKMKDFYEECVATIMNPHTGDAEVAYSMSFKDYLSDSDGYNGELYVCFEEFLDHEYQDNEFMKTLFDNDNMYQVYLEDIQCEKKTLKTAAELQQYFEAEFEKKVHALLVDNAFDNDYTFEDAREDATGYYFSRDCKDYDAIAGMYIGDAAGDATKALKTFLSGSDKNRMYTDLEKEVISRLRKAV